MYGGRLRGSREGRSGVSRRLEKEMPRLGVCRKLGSIAAQVTGLAVLCWGAIGQQEAEAVHAELQHYLSSRYAGYLTDSGPKVTRVGEFKPDFDRRELAGLDRDSEPELVSEDEPESRSNEGGEEPNSAEGESGILTAKTGTDDLPEDGLTEKGRETNSKDEGKEAGMETVHLPPQEEYRGNAEFMNPEEFLIYFEDDEPEGGGDGSVTVPFEVPYQTIPIHEGGRSSATYLRE